VVATEQVTLFGLPIVSGRSVSYGPIESESATEVFIREGLVEQQLEPKPPFLKYNRRQIHDILQMEDRLRRRDLLVSEDERYRFYRQRLKSVYDVRTLKKMMREKGGDDFLRMQPDDLLNYEPDQHLWQAYPARLHLGGRSFGCRYRFDPGSAEDGLTVRVPSTAAPLVPTEEIEWLVPGLLKEKIAALIRNLPKGHRKKLVPVSDTVAVILAEMPQRKGPLFSQLSAFIQRRFGVDIPVAVWSDEGLPEHLRMRLAVIGPRGEVIESSRDSGILKQNFSGSLQLEGLERARQKWERQDIKDWDFGDLPESIELSVSGGGNWRVFPALTKEDEAGARIALRLFRDRASAGEEHRRGVEALLANRCARELKFLRKSIALPANLKMPAARFGGIAQLEKRIEQAVRRRLMRRNIRRAADFRSRIEIAAAEMLLLGSRLRDLTAAIVEADCNARSALGQVEHSNRSNIALQQLCRHLSFELDRLAPDNFLEIYEEERLRELPRLIRANALRAERAAVNIEKDRLKAAETTPFSEALQGLVSGLKPSSSAEKKQALEAFFWLLEEYKVSVFAQELGTATPVSAKRLRRKLDEIERMA
jgi:ATP-dependent helicase HrpA